METFDPSAHLYAVAGSPGPLRAALAAPARRWAGLSLAGRFMLASLAALVLGTVAIGAWVSQAIERGVLDDSAALTALYVNSMLSAHLQGLATGAHLEPSDITTFDHLLAETPLGQRIVAFKIWSPEGELLYSPDERLMGQHFDLDEGLARAMRGDVSAEVSDLTEPENSYERQHWSRLIEVYAPLREGTADGRVIACVEFYQTPEELEAEMRSAGVQSWGVVAGVMLGMYLLLAGLARQGSDTISRQQSRLLCQESALRQRVSELWALLARNAELRHGLRGAAARTTALNEQALRRISADLHAGPGQTLALALLRLDALEDANRERSQDLGVVRRAVQDALSEMRAISKGLRLPLLAALPVAEVVERAVSAHERRSGTSVQLHLDNLPADAPLSIKITLFRALEEALSNATRHGKGLGVVARAKGESGGLSLVVSDQGPGFASDALAAEGHLGLANLRERAELLGGTFRVSSAPGQGTTVRLWMPIVGSSDPTPWRP